ncbi:MAG: hypothetical protein R3286_02605 [Gammaproteobacteria bacterium]|nr:hypothetical protein [Gammaproteobacteria bacterium]
MNITRTALALALPLALALTATTAFASQCPSDMRKIDAALAASPQLSEAQMAQVKDLRAKGEEQHKAGQHAESVQTLGQAKSILGID